MNHSLEDLLDEIQEDEVVDILMDTNELGSLLHAVASNYTTDDYTDNATGEMMVQSFLRCLQVRAKSIREELVRKKYPLMSNDPRY